MKSRIQTIFMKSRIQTEIKPTSADYDRITFLLGGEYLANAHRFFNSEGPRSAGLYWDTQITSENMKDVRVEQLTNMVRTLLESDEAMDQGTILAPGIRLYYPGCKMPEKLPLDELIEGNKIIFRSPNYDHAESIHLDTGYGEFTLCFLNDDTSKPRIHTDGFTRMPSAPVIDMFFETVNPEQLPADYKSTRAEFADLLQKHLFAYEVEELPFLESQGSRRGLATKDLADGYYVSIRERKSKTPRLILKPR